MGYYQGYSDQLINLLFYFSRAFRTSVQMDHGPYGILFQSIRMSTLFVARRAIRRAPVPSLAMEAQPVEKVHLL